MELGQTDVTCQQLTFVEKTYPNLIALDSY